MMDLATRRWVSRAARLGLIVLVFVFIGAWFWRRSPRVVRGMHGADRIRVQRETVAPASLGPGDLQIYNSDSTVDLILQGNRILAGLSPQMVAKIKDKMAESRNRDTSGLGGMIAQTVTSTIASTIGTHAVYMLSDIRDLRYEDGNIIIEKRGGGETQLFHNVHVDKGETKAFPEEDARRFIEAVRARLHEHPPATVVKTMPSR